MHIRILRVFWLTVTLVILGSGQPALATDRADRWRSYQDLKGTFGMSTSVCGAVLGPSQASLQLEGKFSAHKVDDNPALGDVEYRGRLTGSYSFKSLADPSTNAITGQCSGSLRAGSELTLHVNYRRGWYSIQVTVAGECRIVLHTGELNAVRGDSLPDMPISELGPGADGFGAIISQMDAQVEIMKQLLAGTDPVTTAYAPPRTGKSFEGRDDKMWVWMSGAVSCYGTGSWSVEPPSGSGLTSEGCLDLAVGQVGAITAHGNPPGGTYRFIAEPRSVIRADAMSNTAKVTALAPGEGSVRIEYKAPDGKTYQTSSAARSLHISTINEGHSVPAVGLFDVDGKRTASIRTVPMSIQPADAGEVLRFVVANPGVSTVVAHGDMVVVQGLRVGTTTFQARTKCGVPFGPIVPVEVVRCDDGVLAQLASMQRVAQEQRSQLSKAHHDITSEPEFQYAADHIADSAGTLIRKTGALTIGVLTAGGTRAVSAAGKIYGFANDIYNTLTDGSTVSAVLPVLRTAHQETAVLSAETYEALEAAHAFGAELGTMMAANERLENAAGLLSNADRVTLEVARRSVVCRKGGEVAQAVSDALSTPSTHDPASGADGAAMGGTPQAPTSVGSSTWFTGEPAEDAAADTGDELVSYHPPPETAGPLVGLPASGNDRGCGISYHLPRTAAGIATIRQGLSRLNVQVANFAEGSLTSMRKMTTVLSEILTELEASAAGPAKEQRIRAARPLGLLHGMKGKLEYLDKQNREFLALFERCPRAFQASVGVLRSGVAGSAQ